MRKNIAIILAAGLLAACPIGESSSQTPPPSTVIRTKLTSEIMQRSLVERGIEILHVYPDGRVDLAVTDEQLAWIGATGALVSVLERVNLSAPSALDENLGKYHTYAEMNALLDSLALANPSLARIDTLGTSFEGRLIRAIEISNNAGGNEGEPEILIMGAHHAREIMSVEVPLLFAKYLLENYGTDPVVTGLVNSRAVWIIPMVNVDGHVYVEQNHGGSATTWWIKNRRPNGDGSYGVDPNRNYGYNWGYDDEGSSPDTWSWQYRGTAPFSEQENQAVRDLCARRHFVISLTYHAYGEQILFPWGYAAINTPDNDLFFDIGDSLQQGNGYSVGNAASGEIYITNGDSDDWLYGDTETKNRVFGFTIELNSYEEGGYAPPESLIQTTFEKMLGLNLAAMRVAADPRFPSITDSTPPPSAARLAQNYPNPFNPTTTITYYLSTHADVTLGVYDARGRLVASLVNGHSQASGRHTAQWNGRDATGKTAASGVYFCRLQAGSLVQSKKMILLR